MTTETTSRPMNRFAEKLSAFRAGLNKDEQGLLDSIVSGDVEAHAAAWGGWYGKVAADKSDEDVEAHAKVAGKAFALKFNAGRAAYEMSEGKEGEVEAHLARFPKVVDAARLP
ncbi:MAG: hypothetical protein HUU38_25995 [Anaerolineales bacterium]|nr:hypothetical protein [Anaerolineales bacterium]